VYPEERIVGWRGAAILLLLISAGTAAYVATAHLLRAPEPGELARIARRRTVRPR